MTKTKSTLFAAIGLLTGTASTAFAQTATSSPRVFVGVNVGLHASSESFTVDSSLPLYGETATSSADQEANGGFLFDLSGGFRVWNNVAVAVGYSMFSSKSDAAVTAIIPHPIFHDALVTRTATVADLEHSQQSVHLSVVWTTPLTDAVDLSIGAGPSFVTVRQDVVSAFNVPAGTQNFTPIAAEESESATGFHFFGDVSYMFSPMVGVGGLARFVFGSVDLPSVPDLSINGFEVGGGVRLRF